ncbi:MAG: hypothetical protein V3U96_08180 [Paracoccaceae bacterium]
MRSSLTRFVKEETGAVTVDWVVLTGAIIGLSLAVISSISGGALNHADGLAANLNEKDVSSY